MKLTDEKRKAVGELAQAVNNDLTEAIIYFEVSRCDAAVVERFNTARAPEGLNVITFALPLAATAALCRIWDKRGDAATIVGVANDHQFISCRRRGIDDRSEPINHAGG